MAASSYVDDVVARLRHWLPDWAGDAALLRAYALLVLTTGEATTAKNVHDAWSVWCAGVSPQHRSLVPFEDLTVNVQQLDEPYRDAIVVVAREMAVRR